MTINLLSRLTTRRGVVAIAGLTTAAAAAAACIAGLMTFPLVANVAGLRIELAILATAVPVAFPICLLLFRTISRLEEQRRDLHAREELLTTAQRIAKLGYWHFDLKTSRFTLSDNVYDLLGDFDRTLDLTLPVLLSMTLPEDRKKLQGAHERIIRNGSCEQIEYRLTGLDGVEKTFWVDGQRIVDASGKPVRAYGACQDITEQKAMQAALRESEDHYRHSVELNPQIPWTADPESSVLEMGPRWTELTGMSREESLGSGWTAALHPDDAVPLSEHIAICRAEGRRMDWEARFRLIDGSYRWFRLRSSARRDSQGEVIRWYGTSEDIHDRKTTYTALQESEAFSRSVLDSSPDCVKVVDMEGRLQFMNGPGIKLMEISDYDRLHGKRWDDLWPEESRDRVRQALNTARSGGISPPICLRS